MAAVAEVIGEEAALQFQRDFGGKRIYVPADPGAHHPIAVSIGLEKAQALGRVYGGQRIDTPLSLRKKARILALARQDWPTHKIAQHLGCTDRHVRQVKAEARSDSPSDQLSMDL